MTRLLVLAGLLVFGATLHRVAVADDVKKAPADPTAALLSKLRQPLALPPQKEMPLAELVAAIEKGTGVGVVVNETELEGLDVDSFLVRPPRFKGVTAATVLRVALAKTRATYLVRRDHIEITTVAAARREARQQVELQADAPDAPNNGVEPFPLVSAIVKERPLNEVLADLAADNDLTIVLSPQAADQKAAFVTARMLNVPADRAVELLALQADLRVVRRGAAFVVTSKEHSEGLFNERMDREQRKIELENLRNAPAGMLGQPGRPNGLGICGALGFGGNLGALGAVGGAPGGAGFGGCSGKIGFSGGYGI